jgi:hypothetical protein
MASPNSFFSVQYLKAGYSAWAEMAHSMNGQGIERRN